MASVIVNASNWKSINSRKFRARKRCDLWQGPSMREKKWWPDPESNWGHGDFQSPALPTELSCHLYRPFPAPTSLINTGFRNFQARALKFFSFFTSENDYNVNVIDLSGRRPYIMHVLITTHANRKSEDGASQLRFGQTQSG